jgi:hypothetical protein
MEGRDKRTRCVPKSRETMRGTKSGLIKEWCIRQDSLIGRTSRVMYSPGFATALITRTKLLTMRRFDRKLASHNIWGHHGEKTHIIATPPINV